MHATKLLLAAGAGAPALGMANGQKPGVTVYFGRSGTDTLGRICDAGGFDTVVLAYVTASSEADSATNYPAINFGNNCDFSYDWVDNKPSRQLSDCTQLGMDILHCQNLSKKVLLSVSGPWVQDLANDYEVTTAAGGAYFAKFLWKAFGPYDETWRGARPFDLDDSGTHTVLDGFDFDIDVQFVQPDGYTTLLNRLRWYMDDHNAVTKGRTMIMTGAPRCPMADGYSQIKDLISTVVFDKLWIQFFGNDLCPAGSSGFYYEAWEQLVGNSMSKDALLYVGLPPVNDVIGYMNDEQAIALADKLKGRASFGGMMVHGVELAKSNSLKDGTPLYQALYEHLQQDKEDAAMDLNISSQTTTHVPVDVVTKTASVTVAFTKTIFATAFSSSPPSAANSTSVLGTGTVGTVFVTASCLPSGTVPGTALSDSLPSGTRTAATHSYSYSVTSAGTSTAITEPAMAVAMAALVSVAIVYLT
ncbi:hypothetical protein SPBR_05895 [Sporothrix brasiliensis 5110]|uniref:GH18 domain-containing protein n=1 Tax=Sporothrix brasiliensis 5110 TaxID=1398154 RepID=A0A0C2FUI7_9PEZI|nr:uncharacterized protein SPBR_05895 [Sporothrix brasiliensis 5110]KIH94638.1 hypothetical protein SPBR_05895 [Sporothrix brasiliensis 5110]